MCSHVLLYPPCSNMLLHLLRCMYVHMFFLYASNVVLICFLRVPTCLLSIPCNYPVCFVYVLMCSCIFLICFLDFRYGKLIPGKSLFLHQKVSNREPKGRTKVSKKVPSLRYCISAPLGYAQIILHTSFFQYS